MQMITRLLMQEVLLAEFHFCLVNNTDQCKEIWKAFATSDLKEKGLQIIIKGNLMFVRGKEQKANMNIKCKFIE